MALPEPVNPTQLANAKLIVLAVFADHGTRDDAVCALVCALQESSLINGQVGDHGSAYGLFQQHPAMGWGTVAQCIDPAYSTHSFLHGAGTNVGLYAVPSRSSLSIGQQVQAVQGSADGSLYAKRVPLAEALVAFLDLPGVAVSRNYRFISSGTPSYSSTAASRGWGSGWPTDRTGSMTTFSIPTTWMGNSAGTSKWRQSGSQSFQMHRDVAGTLHLLLTEVQRRGYPLVSGWCWGYGNRAIGGTNSPSNHSWGLAADLNAPDNPISFDGRLYTNMPSWVPNLFAQYGWAWGGDYVGNVHDGMHYEFMGTTSDAVRASAAARKELHGGPPPPPPPPPVDPFLRMIMNWYDSKKDFEAMLHALIQQTVHEVLASDAVVGSAAFGKNFQAGVGSGVDESTTAKAVVAIKKKLGA